MVDMVDRVGFSLGLGSSTVHLEVKNDWTGQAEEEGDRGGMGREYGDMEDEILVLYRMGIRESLLWLLCSEDFNLVGHEAMPRPSYKPRCESAVGIGFISPPMIEDIINIINA